MSNGGILRRPAVPSRVRVRRDVNGLADNDPIIVFYEKAIEKMKQGNRIDLPTSWRYQAAIHDYPPKETLDADDRKNFPSGGDPNAIQNEPLPSGADRDKFWARCQHHCWFFLPWHRAYLHFFEKIVAKIVANLPGGPKDWALPYWNYSTSADAAKLPKPFRDAQIDDPDNPGKKKNNNLHVPQRIAAANAGNSFLTAAQTSLD